METTGRGFVSTALFLILSACAGDSLDEVESVAAGQCMGAERVLAVGGVEPPAHIFGDVPDVARLADGGFAALDRQAAELQVFDAEGTLVSTFGGNGEGPGELSDPIGLEFRGDTAYVWDWRQARVTAFHVRDGGHETFPAREQLNPTHHFGLLRDGTFFFGTTAGTIAVENENERWTSDLGLVVMNPASAAVDTVVMVPDQQMGWVDQSIRRVGSPNFSPRASAAVSGGDLYWSRGDAPLILRATGAGVDTISWPWEPRPVAQEDIDQYQEDWLATTPEQMRPDLERRFEVMGSADVYPVVRYLIPDRDGGLWAQIYNRPQDTTRLWIRFENGVPECQAELPAGFIASEGGRRWLLGVGTGELDVERVERWEIS